MRGAGRGALIFQLLVYAAPELTMEGHVHHPESVKRGKKDPSNQEPENHLLYAATSPPRMCQRYKRVSTFLFATRLTNVSRCLRDRDVDRALGASGRLAKDWEGGTRIGQCLHEFNRDWSRRVLAQVPTVLLLTDGLDRDAGEGLTREIERLHKSCRRLIWLNPLLRYDRFQPLAAGIRTILPHVDEFRSIHSLESVAELAAALGRKSHRFA